jgi:hypothetical protein
MKLWSVLLCLLFSASALAAETVSFEHWTVISRADTATGEITLAAYTRNREGHLLVFGQKDNGPIDGALMLNERSASRASAGHPLNLRFSQGGEYLIEGLRIPDSARGQSPEGTASRVEWQLWEKQQGGRLPETLGAMAEAREVTVEYRDAEGELRQTRFSLRGADRALAWVIHEGPMTASVHTVDTLSEEAAFTCQRRANGDSGVVAHCFDGIVACWDKTASGSVAAFSSCLRSEGVL